MNNKLIEVLSILKDLCSYRNTKVLSQKKAIHEFKFLFRSDEVENSIYVNDANEFESILKDVLQVENLSEFVKQKIGDQSNEVNGELGFYVEFK